MKNPNQYLLPVIFAIGVGLFFTNLTCTGEKGLFNCILSNGVWFLVLPVLITLLGVYLARIWSQRTGKDGGTVIVMGFACAMFANSFGLLFFALVGNN